MDFISRITKVKPVSLIAQEVEEETEQGTGLRKVMSFTSVTLFGAANVIGVGIFVTVCKAASRFDADSQTEVGAGPAVILSFALSGLTCALTGVCYSRFSSRMSSSGSAYTYVYSSMGEVFAFFAGLGLCSETSIAAAALCRNLSERIRIILVSAQLSWLPEVSLMNTTGTFEVDYLAPIICLLIMGVCLVGAKESSKVGNVMTVFNVSMILLFIVAGFSSSSFSGEGFTTVDEFMPAGVPGIMRETTTAVFSYIGWDSVCCLSEEVKDAKKTIPRAIAATLMLVGVLYCLLALVVVGLVPDMTELSKNSDLMKIFELREMHAVAQVAKYGFILTALNAAFASAQGQPRLWFRMAKDGLVPYWLCKLNDTGTPVNAILTTGFITCLVSCLVNVDSIYSVITVGVLMMQAFVCIGCLMHDSNEIRTGKTLEISIAGLSLSSIMAGAFLQFLSSPDAATNQSAWLAALIAVAAIGVASAVLVMFQFEAGKRMHAVIPLLAVIANFFFMGSLGFEMIWKLLASYCAVSMVYFFYGLQNSKLQSYISSSSKDVQ